MSTALQQVPRDIKPKPKAYAFERSLGIPQAEACRRAGGKVENGHATKWERNKRVQSWIAYYRSCGHDEEMIAAKRARIEERLAIAAFGNIFDFTEMVERVVLVAGKGDKLDREVKSKAPLIDWDAVKASELAPIISTFKFDKDTGELVHFERDDALAALAQLRDMHGFKAPSKTDVSLKKDATDWTTAELVNFIAESRSRDDRDRAQGGGEG
jgi:hypothetical protein